MNGHTRLLVVTRHFVICLVAIVFLAAVFPAAVTLAHPPQLESIEFAGIPNNVGISQAQQSADEAQQESLTDQTAAELKSVILALKQLALDPTPEVRAAAVIGLARFIDHDESIMDVVWEAAKSSDATVRRGAIHALINLQNHTDQTIDALFALLGDEAVDTQAEELIIGKLKTLSHEQFLPRAIAALDSGNAETRLKVIEMLLSREHNARPAIAPLLAVAASDQNTPVLRTKAVSAVAAITSAVASKETDWLAIARYSMQVSDSNGDRILSGDEKLQLPGDHRAVQVFALTDADQNGDATVSAEELLAFVEVIQEKMELERRYASTGSYGSYGGYPSTNNYNGVTYGSNYRSAASGDRDNRP